MEQYLTHLENYDYLGLDNESLKLLFKNDDDLLIIADDAQNTIYENNIERDCPGEFELLQALYSDRSIMRIYCGKFLNFSDENIFKACINLRGINEINITSNEVFNDLLNRTFQVLCKSFYKEYLNQNTITNGNNTDLGIARAICDLKLKIQKLDISIDKDLETIQKE